PPPVSSPSPMLIKCPCNNCSGHLEFEAHQVGVTVSCPHCGLDTVLFIPQAPLVSSPSPMLIKCPCNNCSGHLEFDSRRAGVTVSCPHCGLDTVLFIPRAPPVSSASVTTDYDSRPADPESI